MDDSGLGRPKLSGSTPINAMSIPMMVICVLNEVCEDDEELTLQYEEEMNWAVNEVLKHLQVCTCTNCACAFHISATKVLVSLHIIDKGLVGDSSYRRQEERNPTPQLERPS